MKAIILIFFIAMLSTSCLSKQTTKNATSQTSTQIEKISQTETIPYNKKLADSLGADLYGMKTYQLVILKTGKNDSIITDKAKRAELFKGHFSNMQKMSKQGKLIVAGPFGNNNLKYRGLFIINSTNENEVRALLNEDPTVKAGIFDFELIPWYGSAALPLYLKSHEEIAKENP